MTGTEVREIIVETCKKLGCEEFGYRIPFKMNGRLRRSLGRCLTTYKVPGTNYYGNISGNNGKIWDSQGRFAYDVRLEFQTNFFFNSTYEKVKELIVHEVCHAVDVYLGTQDSTDGRHGYYWRKYMQQCGYKPLRYAEEEYVPNKVTLVTAVCNTCSKSYDITKRLRTVRMKKYGHIGYCKCGGVVSPK